LTVVGPCLCVISHVTLTDVGVMLLVVPGFGLFGTETKDKTIVIHFLSLGEDNMPDQHLHEVKN